MIRIVYLLKSSGLSIILHAQFWRLGWVQSHHMHGEAFRVRLTSLKVGLYGE